MKKTSILAALLCVIKLVAFLELNHSYQPCLDKCSQNCITQHTNNSTCLEACRTSCNNKNPNPPSLPY